MNKVSEKDSKVISILRFPLAVMIIVLHSMNVENTNVDIPWEFHHVPFDMFVFDILRVLFSRVLGHLVVPCFMVISGYLFFIKFEKWDWGIYKNKIRSRIKTLFIPYILWNVIPVIITILWLHRAELISNYLNEIWNTGIFNMFWSYREEHVISFWGYQLFVVGSPFNTPLWFLRDLIIFVLISPLIYISIKKLFLPTFIIIILWTLNGGNSDIAALMWFFIGASFSLKNISMSNYSLKYKNAFIILFVLCAFMKLFTFHEGKMLLWEKIVNELSIFSGILSIFVIASYLRLHLSDTYKKYIASSSFLIYVLHMEFLWRSHLYLKQLIFTNTLDSAWQAFAVYFLSVPICIVGLLFTHYILIKYFPKLNVILTASR